MHVIVLHPNCFIAGPVYLLEDSNFKLESDLKIDRTLIAQSCNSNA
jgi:hypothetical protein